MINFNEILELLIRKQEHLKKNQKKLSGPINVSKKTAKNDPLRDKNLNALNISLTLHLLKIAESIYIKKITEYLPKGTEDKQKFWDSLKEYIYECLHEALHNLGKILRVPEELKKTLLETQIKDLEANCDKIIHGIFYTLHLTIYCKQYDCTFIRRFDQKMHPSYYLNGAQCIGVVFEWARKLWLKPPSELAESSGQLAQYLKFAKTLHHKRFPKVFLAHDTFLGEPCLNKNTATFQKSRNTILDIAGPPTNFYTFDGNALVTAAFSLFASLGKKKLPKSTSESKESQLKTFDGYEGFQSRTQVNFLEATLIGDFPHMVGIAKIQLNSKTTVYRFIDSEVGEFEARDPKKFGDWLENYFKLYCYHLRFNRFTLRVIDSVMPRLGALLPKVSSDPQSQKLSNPFEAVESLQFSPEHSKVFIAYKQHREKDTETQTTLASTESILGAVQLSSTKI